jgi:hypothetical protein
VLTPLLDTERSLAFLLGHHAHLLCQGTAITTEEDDCDEWLTSDFFAGGLETCDVISPTQDKNEGCVISFFIQTRHAILRVSSILGITHHNIFFCA